ncbi:hypothetical protein NDU88_002685 [Pleurodeles waltl]|uniref:Uncharacterized protein n=1 Tax=Pleurodeles waltl TaxID=8319 RepID=A0AAV7UWC3_PLEWA|nr:hypothetical protein NDU88_002685 [Pleurodeles waltl]
MGPSWAPPWGAHCRTAPLPPQPSTRRCLVPPAATILKSVPLLSGLVWYSALGLLLAHPSAPPGHPSPGATSSNSDTKSERPRGPSKSLQPRGRGSLKGHQGHEGRGSTKPPIRSPGTLSFPAQHARRERL